MDEKSMIISQKRVEFEYIYFLKFIAILLITNSHFKPVYEGGLSQLAFGGAIGCALFFFCSGYTLAYSKLDNFWKWMGKRMLRIYPTLWMMNLLVSLLNGEMVDWSNFLFPRSYWFLQAIIVFYVAYYFVMKYTRGYYLYVAAGMMVPLLCTYLISDYTKWMIDYAAHPYYLHWYFYFSIMLLGVYQRVSLDSPHLTVGTFRKLLNHFNKYILFFCAVIFFLGSYGLKFMMERMSANEHIQLLFPIGLYFTTYFLFEYSKRLNYSKNMSKHPIAF